LRKCLSRKRFYIFLLFLPSFGGGGSTAYWTQGLCLHCRTWNKHPVLCPWVCFSQRASHDCLGQPQSAVFQPLPLKYLGLQGCTTKPFLFLVESLINFFAWAGFKPLK
jgi:hypothetical protein